MCWCRLNFCSHARKCCCCCCCCCGRLCCVPRPLLCCWAQENVRRTFTLMSQRGIVKPGDLVVVVTDMRPAEGDISRSVQVRRVQ